MFEDDITVYHLNEDGTYTRMVFEHVYFEHSKKINVVDKGVQNASTGLIVIPTKEVIGIHEKDVVVEGIVKEELDETHRLSYLQKKYETYAVISRDDMRKGGLPHWEIGVV